MGASDRPQDRVGRCGYRNTTNSYSLSAVAALAATADCFGKFFFSITAPVTKSGRRPSGVPGNWDKEFSRELAARISDNKLEQESLE